MPAPAAYRRWMFLDNYDPNPATGKYVFPRNPKEMTSPFRRRNITNRVSTALDGADIIMEGRSAPQEWSFAGPIIDSLHYEALRSWVYDRPGRRIQVVDHFGRTHICVLVNFDVVPKRRMGRYWYHEYTVTALVTHTTRPSVGEVSVNQSRLGA